MLTLNSGQFQAKLPAWLKEKMAVLVVGPPGTGKTYLSRKVSIETFGQEVVEVLDGGNESEWKALFPYKTPNGVIELGKALRASGYSLQDGKLVKARPGGALVIDEVNRVPPELKSQFHLLASERIVPWSDGGQVKLDMAIVSTGNDKDLGVEETARAELDRYDLIVKLLPVTEEMLSITAGETGLKPEIAKTIVEAVTELAGKLDPKKFHQPEGLRMMISIGRVLKTGTLGPADVFRGTAERCWPIGRNGVEKHRAEFDSAVADIAGKFAGKIGNLGDLTSVAKSAAGPSVPKSAEPATLAELMASLHDSTLSQISAKAMPLPEPFQKIMHLFIDAFGMGVVKHLATQMMAGKTEAERSGVKLHFGKEGKDDQISFHNADRARVEKFCKALK